VEATQTHEKKLRRQHLGNWGKIRILADYSNLKASASTTFIKTTLMPYAISFLTSALTVFPKSQITEVQGETMCDEYKIPSSHQSNGVSGYDLVLYVGMKDAPTDSYLAYAVHCFQDESTLRPVAGAITFNLAELKKINLSSPDILSIDSWVQTAIHEITHILGFSSELYPDFIDPSTNKKVGLAAVQKRANSRFWIITPPVVKHSQNYFNCPSAWGAPLEDNGDEGSAGSHWERITFGNEAMTASDVEGGNAYSTFTLKFLESTGWYLPDYSYAQPFFWGIGEGCTIQ
jgi:leishmanolysin